MTKLRGRTVPISPFRRMVCDLMHFCQQIPAVTVDRHMNLAELAEARQQCTPRPTWTALFTKAYGLTSAKLPYLRQSYMAFPWPRLYEHHKSIASMNFSRVVNGEEIVLQTQVRSPETRSIAELDAIIQALKNEPVENSDAYVRTMALSKWPLPVRRFIIWATMHVFGRRRCHNLGTFGITSVCDRGASILHLTPLLTTSLHYGLFDELHNLDVRIVFDHRVFDGGPAADALTCLEETLLGPILAEVKTMAGRPTIPMPTTKAA